MRLLISLEVSAWLSSGFVTWGPRFEGRVSLAEWVAAWQKEKSPHAVRSLLHVHNGLTPAQLGLCSFPSCAPPTHLPTVGHGQGPDEKSVHGGCKLSSVKRGL